VSKREQTGEKRQRCRGRGEETGAERQRGRDRGGETEGRDIGGAHIRDEWKETEENRKRESKLGARK
jgi:hypothetical protein